MRENAISSDKWGRCNLFIWLPEALKVSGYDAFVVISNDNVSTNIIYSEEKWYSYINIKQSFVWY